jgi:drug/metabolite transporter (DMT)-like permease
MTAIFLALGSSVGWGISDYLGGLKSRTLPTPTVLIVSQSAALVVLTVAVLSLGGTPPAPRYLLLAAASGIGEMLGVAALYQGLARGRMGIVAPLANIAPVVPLGVGLALGEIPAPVQIGGLILVVIGVVLTSMRQRAEAGDAATRRTSLAYGLLAAFGFGTFFVAMDAASEGGIPWALFTARLTAVAVLAGYWIAAAAAAGRTRLAVPRSEATMLAAIGLLIVSADAMYATASTLGLLSIVGVLAALHPIVTVALARIHLKERIERTRYAGIATCLIGVIAITAA